MKRKKFYVSIGALLFGAMVANAQNAVVATGSDAVSSQGATAGISVGQIAVETVVNGSGSLLLGIQQDFSGAVSAVATNPIQNVVVESGGSADEISLNEYFMSNEALTYSATSSNNAVARPLLNGVNLTFVLGEAGTATITVVATTANGEQIPLSFTVQVESKEPVYHNAKEQLTSLCDEAAELLAKVKNPLDLSVREYIPYTALESGNKEAREVLLDKNATNSDYESHVDKMKQLIADFKAEVMKTAVAELTDEPQISVMGRTIYVNGMPCGECALYDIAGKRLYACRNATNTQITVPVAGVYVLMVCGEQHNVAVK